jgi:hypothetical protein
MNGLAGEEQDLYCRKKAAISLLMWQKNRKRILNPTVFTRNPDISKKLPWQEIKLSFLN